jgi:hypothetical protein
LIAPVARTDAARTAPLRLAAAIEQAYCEKLGADRCYSGLITKNPLHKYWHTYYPANEAANYGYYDLLVMAEYANLPKKLDKGREAAGVGRNVSLFDDLRFWSYRAVRGYWRPNGLKEWQSAVLYKAESFNQFSEPLPYAEIKASSNSVSKWVWRRFTPTSFREYVDRTHTTEIQTARGRLGGIAKGKVNEGKRIEALEMSKEGTSSRKIAEHLGVNQSTVIRWIKG